MNQQSHFWGFTRRVESRAQRPLQAGTLHQGHAVGATRRAADRWMDPQTLYILLMDYYST